MEIESKMRYKQRDVQLEAREGLDEPKAGKGCGGWKYNRIWEFNKFISPRLRTGRLPVSSFKNAILQETSILKL